MKSSNGANSSGGLSDVSKWPLSLTRSATGIQVKFRWRFLVIWILAIVPLLWLGTSTGAYLFVKFQRGFSDVHWIDIAMPTRWQHYRETRGDFYIKQAKEQLSAGKFREAFYGLRIGINKSPANRDGRLLLVQFYLLWKRPDLAEQTLLQGLQFHSNELNYLKDVFTFLLRQHRDEKVLQLFDVYSSKFDVGSDNGRLVGLAAATACYFRGNYDRCDQLLNRYSLTTTRDGRLILARVDWEIGDRDSAISRLRMLANDFPKDVEIYAQLGSYLRDTGRFSEARRESLLRSLNNPDDAQSRIDLLYAFDRDHDKGALRAGIEEIFNNFSSSPEVLNALADFAANTGNPGLATRVYNVCRAKDYDWERASLMTIEAYIVAKQYQPALEMVRQLLRDNPDWAKRYASVFNGLQAIALNGLGDAESAQVFVNNYVGQNSIRADDLIVVSSRLVDVGAFDQARQVLLQATKNDPLNQAALTKLILLEIRGDDPDALTSSVRKLLAMRKPPADMLNSAYHHLASDIFLFFPDRQNILEEIRRFERGSKKAG